VTSIRTIACALAIVLLGLLTWSGQAQAQNSICPTAALGDNSTKCASTAFVQGTLSGGLPLLQNYIFVGNASNLGTGVPMSGDCAIVSAGIVTCLKTNGVAFGPLATQGNLNPNSVLGNNTGSPAAPIQLTAAQITAMINLATASLSGALPAWPNNTTTYFRGDGTYQTLNFSAIGGSIGAGNFATGPGIVTLAMLDNTASGAMFTGNPMASAAARTDFTLASLPNLASPSPTLDLLPIIDHTTGTIKNVTPIALSAGGAVSTVNTLAGTVVLVPPPGDARNMKIVRGSTTTLTISYDQVVTATALNGIGPDRHLANLQQQPRGRHSI
jgi:hypothetical protein